MVSFWLPYRANQRPMEPLSEFGHLRTNTTLRHGPQKEYVVLPAGKWFGRVDEQNIIYHTKKDSQ